MKTTGIMNSEMIRQIAALGHTEYLCIADCGLPVPEGVPLIDVAVVQGLPDFCSVLDAVAAELVFEKMIIASEIRGVNQPVQDRILHWAGDRPVEMVPHEEFKALTRKAKCLIRTGEASSYANVILVGGVNF